MTTTLPINELVKRLRDKDKERIAELEIQCAELLLQSQKNFKDADFHGRAATGQHERAERAEARIVELEALCERLKLEAQIHSGTERAWTADRAELEAQVAELTDKLHYYNGTCELAMKHRDAAEAQVEAFRETLETISGFDVNACSSMVNQVFRLKNTARDALMSALRKTGKRP